MSEGLSDTTGPLDRVEPGGRRGPGRLGPPCVSLPTAPALDSARRHRTLSVPGAWEPCVGVVGDGWARVYPSCAVTPGLD